MPSLLRFYVAQRPLFGDWFFLLFVLPNLNPDVWIHPVITYAHLSQVDRIA